MITPDEAKQLTPEEANTVARLELIISNALRDGQRIISFTEELPKRVQSEIIRRAYDAGWVATISYSQRPDAIVFTFQERKNFSTRGAID